MVVYRGERLDTEEAIRQKQERLSPIITRMRGDSDLAALQADKEKRRTYIAVMQKRRKIPLGVLMR